MSNPSGSFSFDMVVFGASGDLALRKLLPALYLRDVAGQLNPDTRILGVARAEMTLEEFRSLAHDGLARHLPPGELNDTAWQRFAARLSYRAADVEQLADFAGLADDLPPDDSRVRVHYLAVAPRFFGVICQHLGAVKLNRGQSRVVLEKPIGHDVASANAINDAIGAVFREEQIFRIDHYLGKETVQNLMALRFANALFEPIWHRGHIEHVQMTVAETVGVEKRGGYYDQSGAMRDMVQNHLLQLLCLVAMEPPASFEADAVRDEKLKVLQALHPIGPNTVASKTVRGQYRAGAMQGQAVAGYAEEVGNPDTTTESFVVLKAKIDNWRWAGVPFFLRTGKRLPMRRSEIVIQFRPVPHLIFPGAERDVVGNRLVIRLQPDEGIELHMMTKVPGPGGMRLRRAPLNLSFAETFRGRQPEAYERLLMDVVRGNPMLFMRRDEVEAAWHWVEPILAGWAALGDAPKPYMAGSWGPSAAMGLIERDGRAWHEDMP
ncbi:glucose-6-phosphate dehydrogenase [Ferrovibrio sp.]|uniref:glucose-6-phosphate dehydrogenase n=1 Tax=Ferrovibrio sp. TaxID=1917215 RepID=UPI003D2C42C0